MTAHEPFQVIFPVLLLEESCRQKQMSAHEPCITAGRKTSLPGCRFPCFRNLFIIIGGILLFFAAAGAFAQDTGKSSRHGGEQFPEPVTIQFKWFHQFQFAGYYAAKEKGFYADEGLNVTLRERDPKRGLVAPVLEKDAEYGVADSGLLLERINGAPVVLLAQIFQHSPLVLIAKRSSGIISPYEMVGKRVMYSPRGSGDAAVHAMLLDTIKDIALVRDVPHTFKIDDLIDGKVDVTTAYITSQPFELKLLGVEFNIINPQSYGIDFYGDNLYTTDEEITRHPERVEKMIRASLKGWQYALMHKEEIIDLIIEKYNPELSRGFLESEAEKIELMIVPDLIQLGDVNPLRYQRIAETYARLGFIRELSVPEGFIYSEMKKAAIVLSPLERGWLTEHPVVRVACDPSWAPIEFMNEKGEFQGIGVEYLKAVENMLKIRFEFAPEASWTQLVDRVKQRELDMFACISMTPEHSEYLTPTEPYLTIPIVVFTRDEVTYVGSLNELKGRKVAVVEGYSTHEFLVRDYPDMDIVPLSTTREALEKLEKNEVFAFVGNILAGSYYMPF